MTHRTHRLGLLLALAMGALAASPAASFSLVFSPAFAQDKKGDKDGKGDGKGKKGDKDDKGDKKDKDEAKEAERERREAEKRFVEAAGREFAAKDAAGLVLRIEDGKKLTMKLGDAATDGSFAAAQAKGVLADWFRPKGEISLKLKTVRDSVGIFDMTVRTGDKSHAWELHVQVRARGKGFVLERIEKIKSN